jgi:CRP/FNR family transcriptional regulator
MAFLFPGDVFGLAEAGHYVNSAQTVTDATLHRILRDALLETLRRDRELEVQFLCKVTNELRELQRQQIVVTRRDAPGRVAMFLRMLDQQRRRDGNVIDIPMSRTDIAQYLSLSPEAVSRATASLEHDGIVSFPSLHAATVLNRSRFERLAAAV